EDGALTVLSAQLHDPLTLNASQAQELRHWLSEQQDLLTKGTEEESATQPAPVAPIASNEETVQQIISDAITQTREHYPAGLEIENRDRFIDQITRDPMVKPLLAHGQISRKQIMLWIEQQLRTGTTSLWTNEP